MLDRLKENQGLDRYEELLRNHERVVKAGDRSFEKDLTVIGEKARGPEATEEKGVTNPAVVQNPANIELATAPSTEEEAIPAVVQIAANVEPATMPGMPNKVFVLMVTSQVDIHSDTRFR